MTISEPIFIVGHPRSGTTLLATILNRHIDVSVTPETQFLVQQPTVKAPISDERFRQMLSGTRVSDLNLPLAETMVQFSKTDRSMRSAFATILKVFQRMNDSKRVGEKSPLHLLHCELLMDWFPDAKILCIERDGHQVLNSLLKMPWSHRKLILHSVEWRKSIKKAQNIAMLFPESFLRVSYEALTESPRTIVYQICAFCGLEYDERILQATESAETIPAWEKAWKGNAQNAISANSNLKQTLTWRQNLIFESVAFDALKDTGYRTSMLAGIMRFVFLPVRIAYHPIIRRRVRFVKTKMRLGQ